MKLNSIIFKNAYLAIILAFALSSCMQEDLLEDQDDAIMVGAAKGNNAALTNSQITNTNSSTVVSQQQIVVKYKDPKITEPQKKAIRKYTYWHSFQVLQGIIWARNISFSYIITYYFYLV